MKSIITPVFLILITIGIRAADSLLIPENINKILGRIEPNMSEKELIEIIKVQFPAVKIIKGDWTGYMGYVEYKLTSKYSISVVEYNEPKDLNTRFIKADRLLLVYDGEQKKGIHFSFSKLDEGLQASNDISLEKILEVNVARDFALPAEVNKVTKAGDGDFLLLQMNKIGKIAVFNIKIEKIIGYIPFNWNDFVVAGPADCIVLFSGDQNIIQRWSIRPFQKRLTIASPVVADINGVVWGYDNNGPILVVTTAGPKFIDGNSLKLIRTEGRKEIVDLKQLQMKTLAPFPTVNSAYYFVVAEVRVGDINEPFVSLYSASEKTALLNFNKLPGLGIFDVHRSEDSPVFMFRDCIIGHPKSKKLIVVDETRTFLRILPFDIEKSLKEKGNDFLFVESIPITITSLGKTYEYEIKALSNTGVLKFTLESSPEGMAISPKGVLTWNVPQNYAVEKSKVIVTIEDSSGKSIFHSFEIITSDLPKPQKPQKK